MAPRAQRGLGQRQIHIINEDLARREMSAFQQKQWLERSDKWSDMITNGYLGRKVLGAGSHGIVGVWEHQGPPPAQMPKLIVVKQVTDIPSGGNTCTEPLRVESVAMGWINGTKTDHVVKLYKMYYETGGAGAHPERDGLPIITPAGKIHGRTKVARIYLEYCRGGSVFSQLNSIAEKGVTIPEEYIWRFLHCMASALVVLMHGNEDPSAGGQTWDTPIVHFDIKPENILINEHNDDHKKLPVYKLGDFGLCLPLPKEVRTQAAWNGWGEAQQTLWTNDALWRCTDAYSSPEQMYPHLSNRIGLRTDIWAIGVVLYEMMTGKVFQKVVDVGPGYEAEQSTFQCRLFQPAGQGSPFETFGRDIITRPYSVRLINLVHRCLAMDWKRRPTARRLLREVNVMMNDVYPTPMPKRGPRAQLNTRIDQAHRYRHDNLVRPTQAEINSVPPLSQRHTMKPEPQQVTFWPVPQQAPVPDLPPFVPGPQLDPQAWPWDTEVPGVLAQPGASLRSVNKVMEKWERWWSGH